MTEKLEPPANTPRGKFFKLVNGTHILDMEWCDGMWRSPHGSHFTSREAWDYGWRIAQTLPESGPEYATMMLWCALHTKRPIDWLTAPEEQKRRAESHVKMVLRETSKDAKQRAQKVMEAYLDEVSGVYAAGPIAEALAEELEKEGLLKSA